jgi:hypothetical protein
MNNSEPGCGEGRDISCANLLEHFWLTSIFFFLLLSRVGSPHKHFVHSIEDENRSASVGITNIMIQSFMLLHRIRKVPDLILCP